MNKQEKWIDVFTCLTIGSAGYAMHLASNLVLTASEPLGMRLHALIDDSLPEECVGTFQGGWNIEERILRPHLFGIGLNAANHAAMLMRIIDHIPEDSDVVIIADVDVALLQNDWDIQLMEALEEFEAVITPKFSGATGPFFSAFRADTYREVKPDWRPGTDINPKVRTKLMDTGYRVEKSMGTRPFCLYQYDDHPDFRYLYSWKGQPMVTHLGASVKKPFFGPEGQRWSECVRTWLTKQPRLHLPA